MCQRLKDKIEKIKIYRTVLENKYSITALKADCIRMDSFILILAIQLLNEPNFLQPRSYSTGTGFASAKLNSKESFSNPS
jgi:hypothetical protein